MLLQTWTVAIIAADCHDYVSSLLLARLVSYGKKRAVLKIEKHSYMTSGGDNDDDVLRTFVWTSRHKINNNDNNTIDDHVSLLGLASALFSFYRPRTKHTIGLKRMPLTYILRILRTETITTTTKISIDFLFLVLFSKSSTIDAATTFWTALNILPCE